MASIEGGPELPPTAMRQSRSARREASRMMFQEAMHVTPPPPVGATRLSEPLVWHDQIPNELMPFADQSLETESFEVWMGWFYWHLDYYIENQFKVRYVADIQHCWNPGGMVATMPWLHLQTTVKVIAAKNRGPWRSGVMMVENGDDNLDWRTNVFWRLHIIGCYLSERPHWDVV